jgi:hypothetical protein
VPTTKRITVAPRIRDQITVDLAGKEYLIESPKASIGLAMADRLLGAGENTQAVMDGLRDWIDTTFGDKQGGKVWGRLMDPEDDVDIPQIVDLITQLAEAATPNPTT